MKKYLLEMEGEKKENSNNGGSTEDAELNEILDMIESAEDVGHQVEWASLQDIEEMMASLPDMGSDCQKLTDICQYEEISPCTSEGEEEEVEKEGKKNLNCNSESPNEGYQNREYFSQNAFSFNRPVTCQRGMGELRRSSRRIRKPIRFQDSSESEGDSQPGSSMAAENSQETVVEPVEQTVVEPKEESVVEPVDKLENTVIEPEMQALNYEKEINADEVKTSVDDVIVPPGKAEPSRPLREEIANFPSTFFEVNLKKTRSFKHKKHDVVNEYSYEVRLRDEVIVQDQTLGNILPQMHSMFASILEEINGSHNASDLVRIFITHQDVVATNIIVGPDYLDKITADTIINHISDVIHSNNFIPANRGLSINVTAIKNISGLNRPSVTNVFKNLSRKGCIIAIDNSDNMCLPRAIAVALCREAYFSSHKHSQPLKRLYDSMRKNDRKNARHGHLSSSLQKRSAMKLMRKAGISFDSPGLLSHVPLYEAALKTGITVISARSGNKKVHNGNRAHPKRITLYHSEDENGNGHYSVLTKVNAILNKNYYCNECDVGFNSSTKHKCVTWCNLCGQQGCVKGLNEVKCRDCNARCRSDECLERHRKGSDRWPSKCQQMFFCDLCGVTLKHPNRSLSRDPLHHVCGENFCNNCKVFYWDDHRCFMRSTNASKCGGMGMEDKRFIFYDFESMLDNEGHHVPNLAVAHSICHWCRDVTHVGADDTCNFCGSRCNLCSSWNKKEKQFERAPCRGCGKRQVIFKGRDTVDQFCSWLISEQHTGVIAMAHNARAYDNYFIYHHVIKNGMKPSIIFRGAKIINFHIRNNLNIRLLDSLNFLTMPLSQLPKSFGLSEMKKGFFPHLYNTQDVLDDPTRLNLESHPPSEFYDPDNMGEGRRKEFMEWYSLNGHKQFDFFRELEEYCKSDVDILLNACWKFREMVSHVTGPEHPIDAFDYITMPSLCMGIFRTKFLPEKWSVLLKEEAVHPCCHEWDCCCKWTPARKRHGDACLEVQESCGRWTVLNSDVVVKEKFVSSPVCLIPSNGYARRDRYSRQALCFIKWWENWYRLEHGLGEEFRIQHALSPDGEKVIVHTLKGSRQLKYKLDGYFRDGEGVEHALEFYGCWFHGCPSCYPRDRDTLVSQNKSMSRRYVDTVDRADRLRRMGFVMHEMWGCDFDRIRSQDSALDEMFLQSEIHEEINVRDAYFGGRTNGIKLLEKFSPRYPGRYYDFCSLYPDVLKYNRYPVGHPVRIVHDFAPFTRYDCSGQCPYHPCEGRHVSIPYFGLMKVRIVPPKRLYFPVLPMKINGKLMFPLCGSCAREESCRPCTCTVNERSLVNTWCTPEIEAAVNMGYEIIQTFEVLHWGETEMINRGTGEGGLFSQYINTFLRIKTQATGYPPGAVTPEQKVAFIEEYYRHEGVRLDPKEIEPNPGLRSLAKLALNSFYGKFGQRENMKKCVFLTKAEEIYKILTDYSKNISDFHLLGDHMLAVEYALASEFTFPDPKTNAVIAAFCTCYARLKLWLEMNRLGKRVVYHDTDSIIFTHDPGGYNPRIGCFLGELTDELTCKGVGCRGCSTGHWIVEFVSCGAKNYAYKLNSGQVVCKVRGFSLNYSSSKVVNLESMKSCLESWRKCQDPPEMVTAKTLILRKKMEGVVYSQLMPKTYGMVYNKRVLLEDYLSIPYGY